MVVTIEKFVNGLETKNTRLNYQSHLNKYFEFIGVQPTEYFDNGRDYNQDFKDYSQHIKNMALCTRKMRLTCIKTYLRKNKVTLEDETIADTIRKVKMRIKPRMKYQPLKFYGRYLLMEPQRIVRCFYSSAHRVSGWEKHYSLPGMIFQPLKNSIRTNP